MALYHYTRTEICEGNQLQETYGLLEAENFDTAINKLLATGGILKDIRIATPKDIQIERLRRYRMKISGEKLPDLREPTSHYVVPVKRFNYTPLIILLIVLILGGLILWLDLIW